MSDIRSKIYFEPSGYGSIQSTFKDAHKIDKTIKLVDVKAWFTANVEQKQNIAVRIVTLHRNHTKSIK